MEFKRFVFEANGEEVIKVTDAGVTAYIAASVPIEVLEIVHRRLGAALRRRIGRLRYLERRWKRRRLEPVRAHTRRRALKKRYRGPLRSWSRVPRR
jgi:hypothetical protein